MRTLVFTVAFTIAALCWSLVAADSLQPSQAPMTVALAVPQTEKQVKTPDITGQRRYAAACGLCTDVDCCGGSENGWKLCQSDCPQGQYKCEQVAACD